MITLEQVDLHNAVVGAIEGVYPLRWYAQILAVGSGLFTPWRALGRVRNADGSPVMVVPVRKLLA